LGVAFQQALLAAGKVTLLTKNAALVFMATISLDLILAARWGYEGVAIAYFVVSIGFVALMGRQLHRMGIDLDRTSLGPWLGKTCISAALMLGVLWLVRGVLGNVGGTAGMVVSLALPTLLGFLIYGVALLQLRVPEAVRVRERLMNRLRH
jgi:peptidoglycan biosynthesis protein MviN/MurJ (putative lipid II flippase)